MYMQYEEYVQSNCKMDTMSYVYASTCIYKLCENDLATPTGIIMICQLTINYTAMFTNLLAKNMYTGLGQ